MLVTVIYAYEFHVFQKFKTIVFPKIRSRQRVPKRRHIKFRRRGMSQRIEYRSADKSLAQQKGKRTRKYVRDARDFNNIETRAVIKFFFFLQGEATKEIHAILTETLACFLRGRAKDLSVPLYNINNTAKF